MLTQILIFIGVTLVTSFLLYLDSRLFDKPKPWATYIKTILLTNLLVFSVIHILTWLSPTKNIKDKPWTSDTDRAFFESLFQNCGPCHPTNFFSQFKGIHDYQLLCALLTRRCNTNCSIISNSWNYI